MRRKVYLSGPIERSDNPETWREEVEDEYNTINFFNPFDLGLDPEEDAYELVWRELDAIRHMDFLLVMYEKGVETYGTPREMFWAWMNCVPVIVWSVEDPEDMPVYATIFSDFIHENIDVCMREGWSYNAY